MSASHTNEAVDRAKTPPARRSARRRALALGLGLVFAVVGLELVLQLLAFVVWIGRSAPEVPRGGAAIVLCCGDSFTYGLRAEDREQNAYPAAAQQIANLSSGPTLQFVNVGVPGQNSERVREVFKAQLERYQPELVYLLVGYNDSWTANDPDAAVEERDPDAFVWEWRTPKLLRVAFGKDYGTAGAGDGDAADSGSESEARPESIHDEGAEARLLGPWHQDGRVFIFGSDRSLRTADGSMDLVYTADDFEMTEGRLWLDSKEAGPAQEWRFRFEGPEGPDEVLILEAADGSIRLALRHGFPDDTAIDRGRQALFDGDLERAEREFGSDSVRYGAQLGLAEVYLRTDRPGEAVELLNRMLFEPDRTMSQFEPLTTRMRIEGLELMIRAGKVEPVFQEIERVLVEEVRELDSGWIEFLTKQALNAPDSARLDRALKDAAGDPALRMDWRLALLGIRAALEVDEDTLVDTLVEVGRLRRDDVWARTLRFKRAAIDDAKFRARVAELPEAEQPELLRAYEEVLATDDTTLRVIRTNVEAMHRMAKARGAELVLMTYPGGRDELAEAQRAIAESLGVECLDLQAHFATILRTDPRRDWFVADGHCNDRGYREMGRLVAEDALRRAGE